MFNLLATCSNIACFEASRINIACFEASRIPEIIPVTAPTSALTGAPTRDVVAAALIPEDTEASTVLIAEASTVLIVVNDASIAPVSLWKAASKLSPSYPSFLNRCEYSSILFARLNLSAMEWTGMRGD